MEKIIIGQRVLVGKDEAIVACAHRDGPRHYFVEYVKKGCGSPRNKLFGFDKSYKAQYTDRYHCVDAWSLSPWHPTDKYNYNMLCLKQETK